MKVQPDSLVGERLLNRATGATKACHSHTDSVMDQDIILHRQPAVGLHSLKLCVDSNVMIKAHIWTFFLQSHSKGIRNSNSNRTSTQQQHEQQQQQTPEHVSNQTVWQAAKQSHTHQKLTCVTEKSRRELSKIPNASQQQQQQQQQRYSNRQPQNHKQQHYPKTHWE